LNSARVFPEESSTINTGSLSLDRDIEAIGRQSNIKVRILKIHREIGNFAILKCNRGFDIIASLITEMRDLNVVVENGTELISRFDLASLFKVVDYKVAWGSPQVRIGFSGADISFVRGVPYLNLTNGRVVNVLTKNSLGPGVGLTVAAGNKGNVGLVVVIGGGVVLNSKICGERSARFLSSHDTRVSGNHGARVVGNFSVANPGNR